MLKNDKIFLLPIYDNLRTIRKPMSNLVDFCWFKNSCTVIWVKKKWKNTKFTHFGKN
jgi:hypothetical protein